MLSARFRIWIAVGLVVPAIAAIHAGSAAAAVGDLEFVDCIANGGLNGCADPNPGNNPIAQPRGVALSPGGNNVYVASIQSNSVSQFIRATNGFLNFAGCFANGGTDACVNPIFLKDPLLNAFGVAVSPDGQSVYVASSASNSVSHFTRDANGLLSFVSCIANDSTTTGCTALASNSLSTARGVAVSPDGQSVYVASSGSNSVSHFIRGGNGSLTFAGCVANGGAGVCANPSPGNNPLSGAFDVEVSPDGGDVYVPSFTSNSVSRFSRDGNGSLTFAGCIANGGANGCADPSPGNSPLSGALEIALSPDGTSVYVASFGSSSISHFFRAGTGSLSFGGCYANGGANGCADPSPGNTPLTGASGVTASPDGQSVYLASPTTGSISNFARAASGSLSFGGCLANDGAGGCTNPSSVSSPLGGARGVAVSPDGRSVYVAALSSNAIARFERQLSPGSSGPPSNEFSFEKVKLNKTKGTAKLTVNVPGPGTLTLGGKGVRKIPRLLRGRLLRPAARAVASAGDVRLSIKPTSRTKKKLRRSGAARVKVKVTYVPSGGTPNAKTKRIKLVRRG